MNKEIFIKRPNKKLISIEENFIIIKPLNTITKFLGNQTIPYQSITAIRLKKPGLTNGFIQFSVLGSSTSVNTVHFTKKNWDDMVWLKEFIESKQQINEPGIVVHEDTSSAEQIKEYKELADTGIITQEEFEKKKAQLLDL